MDPTVFHRLTEPTHAHPRSISNGHWPGIVVEQRHNRLVGWQIQTAPRSLYPSLLRPFAWDDLSIKTSSKEKKTRSQASNPHKPPLCQRLSNALVHSQSSDRQRLRSPAKRVGHKLQPQAVPKMNSFFFFSSLSSFFNCLYLRLCPHIVTVSDFRSFALANLQKAPNHSPSSQFPFAPSGV